MVKPVIKYFLLLTVLEVLLACAANPSGTPQPVTATAPPPATHTASATFTPPPTQTLQKPSVTPSPKPSLTPSPIPTKGYSFSFGIDYRQPGKYIAQGEQTRLTNKAVVEALSQKEQGLAHLGKVYFWIKNYFTPYSAGGSSIGVATVDQLMNEKRLGGCHDWGLVFISLVRELGYPAVLVDTASIGWMKQTQAGQKGPYVGHVFVEVYLEGKWVLVDSTNNWYVESGYDPANPVIPLKGKIAGSNEENAGFYVMRKGVDTRGYGIHSNAELMKLMEDTAKQVKVESLTYPEYNFLRFK